MAGTSKADIRQWEGFNGSMALLAFPRQFLEFRDALQVLRDGAGLPEAAPGGKGRAGEVQHAMAVHLTAAYMPRKVVKAMAISGLWLPSLYTSGAALCSCCAKARLGWA